MNRLAIVVPCFNEEEVLKSTNKLLLKTIEKLMQRGKINDSSFILYVDDGSKDNTWDIIKKNDQESKHVYGLKLAGNVGHQNALIAGMLAVKDLSDMVVSIDADYNVHACQDTRSKYLR